ncbi:hypothetical protein PV10_04265 [Exophiala mesophila]|uniref:Uncharacterized protein n=1 Tax=Exophiala mesophila TaxID=212818 RepID=A0A0D1WUU3_EXOME|nr:uncharacterized protein PV10_04265 [Exophiala mesophila]KIV93020.1 hypothetical protein PV10_04265 [Exophiala mesophila]
MAGLSTPNPRQQPSKQMSSRLLNMKFMQRASASTPTSATSTPKTQPSYTNTPTTEPSSKRRKIASATDSPFASDPASPIGTPSEGFGRLGTSTFVRPPGAETEWVLDLNDKFLQPAGPAALVANKHVTNGQGKSSNNSIPGLGDVSSGAESEGTDEDMWRNQPPGRQTFGVYKKKQRTRTSTSNQPTDDDSNGDSDEGSDSGSDSENGSQDSDSDSADSSPRSKSRSNSKKSTGNQKTSTRDVDSDEEMRRVRREMEQKHSRMAGTSTPKSTKSPYGPRGSNTGSRPQHKSSSRRTPGSGSKRKHGQDTAANGNKKRKGGSGRGRS